MDLQEVVRLQDVTLIFTCLASEPWHPPACGSPLP
jgi:hypothetical protein